ncbi:MAG: 23S rRNA (uracil(1939)-C(5))-methyltransferase RlmD [Gammaproteobacteria bacterium]|nr:23S rRNA (uracil(1939)-C(5))-methyltransferase RlmD [Gammaproteobacteria bacterium]
MRRPRNFKLLLQELVTAHVESLSSDGRGVAHVNGKAVFIEGALPGEQVLFTYVTRRKRYDEAKVEKIIKPSPDRVEPRCAHFNICGGCSLQHLSPAAQIAAKQQVLLDGLKHIGGIEPKVVLAPHTDVPVSREAGCRKRPPLTGPSWGYRRRARLGVKFVIKKDKLLIGFREKRSSLLADIDRCEVLHPPVGGLLPALRELIAGLEAYNSIPQIEVAAGDEATALVFRNLVQLSDTDLEKLQGFGKQQNMQIYLQPAGPESVTLIWPEAATLSYRLPEFNLELFFSPADFVQINADVNRAMISRVIELLAPKAHERVLDLFCGLGNFTLPLARHAGQVTGVEGEAKLIQRAQDNAQRNGISNAAFYAADLSQDLSGQPWAKQRFDKILLDPPRTGALEIIQQLPAFGATRIVYVSCNPATLARDARALTENGYTLMSAGVLDMFPHTTHVESIALFEKCENSV